MGRPLIDWSGSWRESLCDRRAGGGKEAAKDGGPEGRGKPGHCVWDVSGREKQVRQLEKDGPAGGDGRGYIREVTSYPATDGRLRAPGVRNQERGVSETSRLWLRLFVRGWVSVG